MVKKNNLKKKEKVDALILLVCPIVATIISFILNLNFFLGTIAFLGIPSIYLTIRGFRYAKKSFLFSMIIGIPMGTIIDYMAHVNGQWLIPNSVFTYRLFGFVTFEALFWAILNLYCVILFYEYFLDKHFTKRLWQPHMKYLIAGISLLFTSFLFFYSFFPRILNVHYFYFWVGLLIIFLPVLIQLFAHFNLASKILKTAIYFFYISFAYEITALQLGWWTFPGNQFIGWVSFFGVTFPVEEFLFWLVFFSMSAISYYEYFECDEK